MKNPINHQSQQLSKRIRNLLTSSKSTKSRASMKGSRDLGYQSLESRQLLAAIDPNFAPNTIEVTGSAGNDTVIVTPDASNQNFTITLTVPAGYGTGATFTGSYSNYTSIVIKGLSGDDVLDNASHLIGNIEGNGGADIIKGGFNDDVVIGGNGNDVIWGRAGNDTLSGNDGADEFWGFGGVDSIYGGAGNDEIHGGEGNDILYGFGDDDLIYGEAGLDVIYGGDGNDQIDGGESADTIHGEAGDDLIDGYSGWDTIFGGAGIDTIDGGYGDDTLYGDEAADVINGGEGNDKIYGGLGADDLNGNDGDDEIYGQDGEDDINGGVGIDSLSGGNDDDSIRGSFGIDLIQGDAGNDFLLGEYGHDNIYGGDGDDYIDGGMHDDNVYGGDGNDRILGRDGNDSAYGGLGVDRIFGAAGNDHLDGGDGDDHIEGNAGDDVIYGGAGKDELFGDDLDRTYSSRPVGNDEIYGGDGDDDLYGGAGDDLLRGEAGKDYLSGSTGNDSVFAGFDSKIDGVAGYDQDDRVYLYGTDVYDPASSGSNPDPIINLVDGDQSWSASDLETIDAALDLLESSIGNNYLALNKTGSNPQITLKRQSGGGSDFGSNIYSGGTRTIELSSTLFAQPDAQSKFVHLLALGWANPNLTVGNESPSNFYDESDWTASPPNTTDYTQAANGWWYKSDSEFFSGGNASREVDWATSWEHYFFTSTDSGNAKLQLKLDALESYFNEAGSQSS